MCGVHTEKSAAIRSKLFDRYDRRDRSHDYSLLLCLTFVVGAHCPRFERRYLIGAGEGHRHALVNEQHAYDESYWDERVDHDPPHIDKKVADLRLAPESSDDCSQSTESHRGGDEHHRDDEENLAEVREMLIA